MVNLNELSYEELKTVGDELEGFKYDKRWGEEKLREIMTAWIEENPDAMANDEETVESTVETGEDNALEETPEEIPEEPAKPGELVKIKSIHRGVISSSVGSVDFGEDGVAEVTAKQAEAFIKIEGYEKC